MGVNVFAGARRIAVVVGFVWVGVWVAHAWSEDPYVNASYAIGFNGTPVKVKDCGQHDATQLLHGDEIAAGADRILIFLCFTALKSEGGDYLVPYAFADAGKVWMAGKYSDEVRRYTKQRAAKFSLPPEEIAVLVGEKRKARKAVRKEAVLWAVGGLVGGWFAMVVVGWIVRGFLGIPLGFDARHESKHAAAQ